MTNIPSDDSAFPRAGHCANGDGKRDGMSLRDYFAAKAMQATIESQLHDGSDVPEENIPKFFELVAGYAYIAADAMLAERAK